MNYASVCLGRDKGVSYSSMGLKCVGKLFRNCGQEAPLLQVNFSYTAATAHRWDPVAYGLRPLHFEVCFSVLGASYRSHLCLYGAEMRGVMRT